LQVSADTHSATILIVDDTPINLRVIVESLESQGYQIVVATRGEEALKRASYVQPDLILLDVMMPDLNGFEICRRLKAQPDTRDIPVIFMTSLASVDDKVTGFSVGALDYVTKPLHVEEVRARVDTHLRLRAMQKELEKQTEQLKAANEELEAFAYSVSHDLRAPLRAINGFARILEERCGPTLPPEGIECLQKVQFASKRMDVLIQDLLSYARTGRGSIRAVPVPLLPVIEDLECTFGERLAATHARFEVPQPLATPLGDPTLIEQILMNLLDNALKYRRRDTDLELKLTSTATAEHVLIQLADNGIGMPLEYQDKIFQVFRRLHHEHEYPGTGIGLAIVAKATRAMGGDVTVESAPGQGSTFSVRLPAAFPTEASVP
jgi:two-component system, sensor histidine kinase and response regulator